jgi:DNA modification methylase
MDFMKNTIIQGDCREGMRQMSEKSVQTCVTSPPYFGLRDYGHVGQIGLEQTPDEYVQQLVEVFREVRRVLRDDGTVWLNLGDSYAGSGKGVWNVPDSEKANVKETCRPSENPVKTIVDLPPKNLIGIPWRVAFALQADGWILRQDIIWHKPNPMPESVTDRCTKAHEYIFLFSKSAKYYYDADAIKEVSDYPELAGKKQRVDYRPNGTILNQSTGSKKEVVRNETRNKRSVWTVATKPYAEAHFATFPPELITPCILAGCPEGGLVLDPFMGSGTVAATALRLNRNYLGCELNPDYITLANKRIYSAGTLFVEINPIIK